MNALMFYWQSPRAKAGAQIARTFGVDWPHLVAQIISFSIVCALLYQFAYRRILAMLEQRRQKIARVWPMPKRSKRSWRRRKSSARK